MANAVKIGAGAVLFVAGAVTGNFSLSFYGVSLLKAGLDGAYAVGSAKTVWSGNPGSSDGPLPVVYGIAKLGPRLADIRVDRNSPSDKDLAWVGVLCVGSENGGGIESVENVWMNETLAITSPVFEGEPSTSGVQAPFTGLLEYGLHAGTDAQTVDSELNSRFSTDWTSTAKGRGLACIALFETKDDTAYPNGVPTVTLEIKGNKVYDPRSDTWAWSDNPALCILDYLTSKRYGIAAPYSERDGGSISAIDEASFEAAANYFDELVSIPGATTQKRFRCNGVINTGDSLAANLERLESSCRSTVVFQGGVYRLVPRKAESAQAFELNESNIIGGWEFSKSGIKGVTNRVSVTFVDIDADYQTQEVVWPEADQANTYLTADNGWESLVSIGLPFTSDLYMAQQIGQTLLKESRADLAVAVNVKEEALQTQPGEVLKVTHSTPGWTEKLFRVTDIGINPDATVRLALREYDATAYTLSALNEKDALIEPDIPDPNICQPPTGLILQSNTATSQETQDGQKVPAIQVDWTTAAEPFLSHYELQFKVTSGGTFESAPNPLATDEQIIISGVTDKVNYTVQIRAVNASDVKSVWVSDTVTVATDERAATGSPSVQVEGALAKLYPGFLNAASFKWVTDETDPPTITEVRAGAASTVTTGVTAHTFTTSGEQIWVGVLLYTDASTTENESALFVIPKTYGQSTGDSIVTDGDGDLQVDAAWINIFSATDPGGAFTADDEGRTWIDTSEDPVRFLIWDGTAWELIHGPSLLVADVSGSPYASAPAGATWNAIRSSGGTGVFYAGVTAECQIRCDTDVDEWDNFSRHGMIFDTDGRATPSRVTITCTVNGPGVSDFTGELALVGWSPASDTSVVAGDFDSFGVTKLSDDLIYPVGPSGAEELTWTLNAAGLAAFNTSGFSYYGIRQEDDRADTEPTWVSEDKDSVTFYTVNIGDSRAPIMRIYP